MTTAKSSATGAPPEAAPQEKRQRVMTATVSYPYHPLELCIDLAKAVREIGNGRAEVTKSQLAHRLNISEQSSDLAQKIASSKTYGLIDGRSTFQLTDTARQYLIPTEDSDDLKKRCLFKFFESPGLFKELISLYEGSRPPSIQIMGNLAGEKFGIPESWKMRVGAFFIRSAQFAGAMGQDGFLRFKAQRDGLASAPTNGTAPKASVESPQIQPSTVQPSVPPRQDQDGVIVWTYPCAGKILRIETPENMTKEVWEKLNKYIQVLEP